MLILISEREADARGGARKGHVNRSTAVTRSDGPAKLPLEIGKESMMTNSNHDGALGPQAELAGDVDGAGTLKGRAGASLFSIGGPDGRGGTAGTNPYDLLSASVAACTAMTIRLQARRRKSRFFPTSM